MKKDSLFPGQDVPPTDKKKSPKAYKIIGLKVDGFKKLTALEMEFNSEGGLIFIKGDNEQGKTTLLESLYWAFAGKTVINPHVIQHGKSEASVRVLLNGLLIEREITEDGKPKLKVIDDSGFQKTSPQNFLDSLRNELTFNPWPFLNLDPEKKLRFMMDFLNIDFTELDEEIAQFEKERLIAGRQSKALGDIEIVEPVEQVDIASLLSQKNEIQAEIDRELNNIRQFNQGQINLGNKRRQLKETITKNEKEINNLQLRIQQLEQENSYLNGKLFELPEPQPEKPAVTSLSTKDIDEKIKNAGETNRMHDRYQEYQRKKQEKETLQKQYDEYTKAIEYNRNEKKRMLQETDTGVLGLTISEDGLYLNGIYSENWSDSQKLYFAAQLCKTMYPPLKALFIDRGESFGKKRLEVLKQFAKENDIQVFITQVANEIPENVPDNTFYIVEGEVVK
jgi:DNA repair exonuclease SbcCD ATPase subunit